MVAILWGDLLEIGVAYKLIKTGVTKISLKEKIVCFVDSILHM